MSTTTSPPTVDPSRGRLVLLAVLCGVSVATSTTPNRCWSAWAPTWRSRSARWAGWWPSARPATWLALPDEGLRPITRSYGAALAGVAVLTATDRVFRTRALIAFFLFASFGVLWSGLALPLSAAPWQLSPAQIGLFGFVGLAGTLGAARAGRWADRGHGGPVTVAALVLLIASWWFTGQATWTLWLVAVGAILLDFAVQAVHVTNQNLIVAQDPGSSSRTTGAYMIYCSLGSGLGAVTASTLFAGAGWTAVSAIGACFAAAALAVWLIDRAVPTPRCGSI